MCINAQSPHTGSNPCYEYYMNGVGLYPRKRGKRPFSGTIRPPVERGKKHLFSHIGGFLSFYQRQIYDKAFSKWKVNEVTFCKSMEVTDLGRDRIKICRLCPNYSLGLCKKCGETMVLVVSNADMKCPEDKWDPNASSEWCSGHI